MKNISYKSILSAHVGRIEIWKAKRFECDLTPQDRLSIYWDPSDLWGLGWADLVSAWGFIKNTGVLTEVLLSDCVKCGRFLRWWDFFPLFIFGLWDMESWLQLPFSPPIISCKEQDFSSIFSKNFLPFPMACLYVLYRRLSLRISVYCLFSNERKSLV